MTKKLLDIFLALLVIAVLGIIIVHENRQKNNINPPITNNNSRVLVEPTIEDVVTRLKTSETAHIDTSTWEEYISPRLGIKFKYPPTLFIFDRKIYGVDAISLFQDIPRNHSYVEDPNSSEMPSGVISINVKPFPNKFIAADYIKKTLQPDVLKWKEITFHGNSGFVYTGQSAEYFDGLTFIRNGFLYEFNVSFWPDNLASNNETEQTRDDYYKILSTLELTN